MQLWMFLHSLRSAQLSCMLRAYAVLQRCLSSLISSAHYPAWKRYGQPLAFVATPHICQHAVDRWQAPQNLVPHVHHTCTLYSPSPQGLDEQQASNYLTGRKDIVYKPSALFPTSAASSGRCLWQVDIAVVTKTVTVRHNTSLTSPAVLAAALNEIHLDASLTSMRQQQSMNRSWAVPWHGSVLCSFPHLHNDVARTLHRMVCIPCLQCSMVW